MPGLVSALVPIWKAEGSASCVARPGGVPMSLGCVMGLGAPTPVLEETGFLSVVLSLGSVDVPPTWGRVPAASQAAVKGGMRMCKKNHPCMSATGTVLGHITVPT